jgi:outer membrane immunogenic protein
VAEWLKAPHSKFGGGDNLGCYPVPTCLNKLTIFKHRCLVDTFGCAGRCFTEITSIGTVRGRVGYAFDRFLPYVTAGAAFTRLHSNLGVPVFCNSAGCDDAKTTKTDFVVGGGLEYAFAFLPGFSAKAEYLSITKLGDQLYAPNDCVAPGCFSRTEGVNLFRFGLNSRFGGGWFGRSAAY